MENFGMFLGWAIMCALFALIGRNRKIGYGWTFLICVFASPLIGMIVALCSKKKDTEFIDANKNE